MKTKYSVSIVIPNWNGKDLLKKHLRRVIEYSYVSEVIVVDDQSTDGSVGFLKKEFPEVIIVEKINHEGFAGTVNAGVTAAHGDIVYLINTDAEPEKGYLEPVLSHFDDKSVFAVGSMDKSSENGKTVLRGRGVARWVKGYYQHARGDIDNSDTAWVSGGSGAFRRKYWEALGHMDILYNPFYWEDIDICYRAGLAGLHCVFEPKSIVNHYHEEGKIKQEFSADDIKRVAYRNQFTFIWKNASVLNIIKHKSLTPIKLIKAWINGDRLMVYGFWDAFVRLPQVIAARFTNFKRVNTCKKLLSSKP